MGLENMDSEDQTLDSPEGCMSADTQPQEAKMTESQVQEEFDGLSPESRAFAEENCDGGESLRNKIYFARIYEIIQGLAPEPKKIADLFIQQKIDSGAKLTVHDIKQDLVNAVVSVESGQGSDLLSSEHIVYDHLYSKEQIEEARYQAMVQK